MKPSANRAPDPRELDLWHMRRALDLARQGAGAVEPNPLVGCVIARGAEIIGEGWHRRFGGPHAEVEALAVAGPRARGATAYVTLEPCCHHGKTPPCTNALIAAGVARVVCAQTDPFPAVAGKGIAALRAAGMAVTSDVLAPDAVRLNAPYLKLLQTGRPWVIAKWAMTLDGKLATATGDSRWISGEAARDYVHQLRGRVDAILVGSGTARADNPLLTARPPGPRQALRVVVDSRASLPPYSQLLVTARQVPLLVAVGPQAAATDLRRLEAAGCEVFLCSASSHAERLGQLLDELGRRRLTNLLVEGGAQLLGNLHDAGQIDYVCAFVAPRLLGGRDAPSPLAGRGRSRIAQALQLSHTRWQQLDGDLLLEGFVEPPPPAAPNADPTP